MTNVYSIIVYFLFTTIFLNIQSYTWDMLHSTTQFPLPSSTRHVDIALYAQKDSNVTVGPDA